MKDLTLKKLLDKIICCLLVLFATPILAVNAHFYLTGSLATSQVTLSKRSPQIVYYGNLITDAYPLQKRDERSEIFGFTGGYEFANINCYGPKIALGLGFYASLSDFTYQGQLIETTLGDPSIPLYGYQFHLISRRLLVDAQFTWMVKQLATFINVGAGPSWNRLKDYQEKISGMNYPPLPAFQSRTNNQFAYQLGFGVGYPFHLVSQRLPKQSEQISLAYRYVALGHGSFGNRGDVYPYSLKFGNLYSQEIAFIYTYFF